MHLLISCIKCNLIAWYFAVAFLGPLSLLSMCKTDSVNEWKYILPAEYFQLLIEPKLNLLQLWFTNPTITHHETFPESELLNACTYIKLEALLEKNSSNHSRAAISRVVKVAIFNNTKWSISESG